VYRRQQEEAQREAQTTGEVTFKSLYGTDGLSNPPVLLVDGYNVIGLSREAKGGLRTMESAELDGYRDQLLSKLTAFSHHRGIKVILVYDAMNGFNRGSTVRERKKQGVDVIWAGASEADTFISMHVEELYEQGCPYVLVATNDTDLQTTSSENDAYMVSSRRLLNEMRAAEKEIREQIARINMRPTGRATLLRGLNTDAMASLEALRDSVDTSRRRRRRPE